MTLKSILSAQRHQHEKNICWTKKQKKKSEYETSQGHSTVLETEPAEIGDTYFTSFTRKIEEKEVEVKKIRSWVQFLSKSHCK